MSTYCNDSGGPSREHTGVSACRFQSPSKAVREFWWTLPCPPSVPRKGIPLTGSGPTALLSDHTARPLALPINQSKPQPRGFSPLLSASVSTRKRSCISAQMSGSVFTFCSQTESFHLYGLNTAAFQTRVRPFTLELQSTNQTAFCRVSQELFTGCRTSDRRIQHPLTQFQSPAGRGGSVPPLYLLLAFPGQHSPI